MKIIVAKDVEVRFSWLGRLAAAFVILVFGKLILERLTLAMTEDPADKSLLPGESGRPVFGQTVDPFDPPKA